MCDRKNLRRWKALELLGRKLELGMKMTEPLVKGMWNQRVNEYLSRICIKFVRNGKNVLKN